MEFIHFSKFVFAKARKRGNHRILFYRDNSLAKWVGITWSELAEKVQTTARAMVQVGVKEHDNIAICSQNKPHCVIVDFANFANRAPGIIPTAVNPKLRPKFFQAVVESTSSSVKLFKHSLSKSSFAILTAALVCLKRPPSFNEKAG